jgi:hypothetical protein
VNVFLLLVYLERPACASYELMTFADGSGIIRMYEVRVRRDMKEADY